MLSRRVVVNQLKLKQLFRRFFDTTPYAMLLEIRMQTAYQLLQMGQFHVSTVADRVGYRHANNFSLAFKRYFSIPPKQVAGKGQDCY